jgi:hypothetical protein
MYEAPKVELIEMEAQGVLCSSAIPPMEMRGTGMNITNQNTMGSWNN